MKGRVLNALLSSNTNFDMFDMIKRAARGKAIGKFSEKGGPQVQWVRYQIPLINVISPRHYFRQSFASQYK